MNTWMFLITALFSQDDFLVKQGDVTVPLADLDAYVYLLGEHKRPGFADQPTQIEQNIFTLLNVNIVYQHIIENGLNDEPEFEAVLTEIENREYDLEDGFFEALELNQEAALESIRMYLIKTRFYRTMLQYLDDSITAEQVEPLAKEHYLINKKDFVVPEKRDISVIMLEQNADVDQVLKSLSQADQEAFQSVASDVSVDPSKELNQGHWGKFRLVDFNYPFTQTVFNAPVGVIPQVLTDSNHAYIIRVNEVQKSRQQSFDEVKDKLVEQVRKNVVGKKFQSIINAQGRKELEVNPELTAHVFERYKVFNSD